MKESRNEEENEKCLNQNTDKIPNMLLVLFRWLLNFIIRTHAIYPYIHASKSSHIHSSLELVPKLIPYKWKICYSYHEQCFGDEIVLISLAAGATWDKMDSSKRDMDRYGDSKLTEEMNNK